MPNPILELDQNNFAECVKNSDKNVLVDFWAPWCGPCKAIAPILEELAQEMGDQVQVCKVNIDNNSAIAGDYSIRAIPTILIFKNGVVSDTLVGLTSKDDLKAKLV